jgi:hypothetical protein
VWNETPVLAVLRVFAVDAVRREPALATLDPARRVRLGVVADALVVALRPLLARPR